MDNLSKCKHDGCDEIAAFSGINGSFCPNHWEEALIRNDCSSDHSYVLRIGSYYPGYYLCGQEALSYASWIRSHLQEPDNGLAHAMLLELAGKLESCEV